MRKRMILLWLGVCFSVMLCTGAAAQGKDRVLFDRIGTLVEGTLPPIDSIQVLGDKLYMLDIWCNLYCFDAAMDVEPVLVDNPGDDLGLYFGVLCSDGNALYLISRDSGEGFRWEEGSWTSAFQLDQDFASDLLQPMIVGDFLYALRPDGITRGEYKLIRFTLEGGKHEVLDVEGLRQLMAYQGDQLLAVAYDEDSDQSRILTLQALNAQGEVIAMQATLPYAYGTYIAYDAASDAIFATSGGEYLRLAQDAWETVGYVNTIYADNAEHSAAFSERFVLAGLESGVSIAVVSGIAAQTEPVRIAGVGSNEEMLSTFRKEHPDIQVLVLEERYANAQEMADSVRSGDSEIDIFVLESTADLAEWKEKGFAAPLDSAVIQETVAQMYPEVQQVLSYGEDIIAIPSSIDFSVLGYHSEIVEQFGYEGPPTTVQEYVEMLLRWQQEFGGDHNEYAFDHSGYGRDEFYRNLAVQLLLSQYVMSWPEDAGTLSLDMPEFREVLSLIGQLSSGNEPNENVRNYLYPDTALFRTGSWSEIGWGDFTLYEEMPFEIVPLPTFGEGDSPQIEMSMQVYVLNPNSQNQEQALAVLEGLVSAIPIKDAYILFPDRNEPVEHPDYARSIQERTEYIQEMETALENAQPDEKNTIEDEISWAQSNLDYWEENRWAYTPQQIATLREMMPHAVFREDELYMYNPYNEQEPSFLWEVLNRYFAGQLTMDQAVREMDRKLQMMQQEI